MNKLILTIVLKLLFSSIQFSQTMETNNEIIDRYNWTPEVIKKNSIVKITLTDRDSYQEILTFDSLGNNDTTKTFIFNLNLISISKYDRTNIVEELVMFDKSKNDTSKYLLYNDTMSFTKYNYVEGKLDDVIKYTYPIVANEDEIADLNIEIFYYKYNEDGLLDKIRKTTSGNRHELIKYFDKEGRLIRETKYQDYEEIDTFYNYTNNKIECIKDGEMTEQILLNNDGKVIERMRIFNNQKVIEQFHFNENGSIKLRKQISNTFTSTSKYGYYNNGLLHTIIDKNEHYPKELIIEYTYKD